jgi:hypothetical protein
LKVGGELQVTPECFSIAMLSNAGELPQQVVKSAGDVLQIVVHFLLFSKSVRGMKTVSDLYFIGTFSANTSGCLTDIVTLTLQHWRQSLQNPHSEG